MFIIATTGIRQWSLSEASWIQSTSSYPISWRYNCHSPIYA
jgi:hypothetical protein